MSAVNKLLKILETLRDPQKGCPWDLKQTHESLAPYLIEEAYEYLDALQKLGPSHPKTHEELGDVVFQIVFHSQLFREKGYSSFEDIVDGIANKMIERHPHVFSQNGPSFKNAEEVAKNWESLKKNKSPSESLNSIPKALPALLKASRLGEKASSFGFDWPDSEGAWQKVQEEMKEVQETHPSTPEEAEEIGDLFFALAQWCRKKGYSPETLLESANQKFLSRFEKMEALLNQKQVDFKTLSPEEWDEAWNQAKLDTKS